MIGVFDSGVGGLFVLSALRAAMPDADFLYYADTARLPFGVRSPDLIRRYAREAGARFAAWGVDSLQVACGTVSALALGEIGDAAGCPVAGVIRPVAREIAAAGRRRVLILSTEATAASRVFDEALAAESPGTVTLSLGCPLFVSLVENGFSSRYDPALLSFVGRTLAPGQTFFPDAVLLGCTHFRLLSHAVAALFPGVPLFDCGEAAARALADSPAGRKETGRASVRILVSDNPDRFRRAALRVGALPDGATVECVGELC